MNRLLDASLRPSAQLVECYEVCQVELLALHAFNGHVVIFLRFLAILNDRC